MKLPTLKSFSAGKLESALIGRPHNLESICYVLNDAAPRELSSELRTLVKRWQESGPNLVKLLDSDKTLADRTRHGRTLLVPTASGRGHLLWLSTSPDFNPRSWKDHALAHFLDLVVNPQWHKLGGPCARCSQYYIKKTKRQKTYCSRKCGSALTAATTVQKARKAEHEHKLRRAQIALDSWASKHTRLSWKQSVSNKTRLTTKGLTRALNKGELQVPGGKSVLA